MTPYERAKYLIEQLGIEGAKRQALEDIGNADSHLDDSFHRTVFEQIKILDVKKNNL